MTCGVWVGYDEKKSLGARETGAHAALPIWMNFMSVAMNGKDGGDFLPPPVVPHATEKVDTPDTAPATEESH
jgi:penicillin-binding protein 1A